MPPPCWQKVCAPSRASTMSGRYPFNVGFYEMPPDDANQCLANTTLLPQLLRDMGYSTHALGKWGKLPLPPPLPLLLLLLLLLLPPPPPPLPLPLLLLPLPLLVPPLLPLLLLLTDIRLGSQTSATSRRSARRPTAASIRSSATMRHATTTYSTTPAAPAPPRPAAAKNARSISPSTRGTKAASTARRRPSTVIRTDWDLGCRC